MYQNSMGAQAMGAQNPYSVPANGNNGHGPMASNQSTSTHQQQKAEQFRNQILKQQRLLLFLRHCAKCKNPQCTHAASCETGKELWHHLVRCKDDGCKYPRCVNARELLRHYQKCQKVDCSICGPVRKYVEGAKPITDRQGSGQNNGQLHPLLHGSGAPANGIHQMPMHGHGHIMQPNGLHHGQMVLNGMHMQHGGMHPGGGMHGGMQGMVQPGTRMLGVKSERGQEQPYYGGMPHGNGLLHHEPDTKRPHLTGKSMAEIKVCCAEYHSAAYSLPC